MWWTKLWIEAQVEAGEPYYWTSHCRHWWTCQGKIKKKRVLCIKDIDDIANILLLSIQFLGTHNFIFCVIKLVESIKHLRLLKATGFGELNTNRHAMSQTQRDLHRMSGSIEIVRKKTSNNKRKLLQSVTVSAKM